jgi:hypothetical protein
MLNVVQTITSMNHFDFNSKYRTDILNGSNFGKRNGEQMYNITETINVTIGEYIS